MDVQRNDTRDRIFSILNDNDCPSFVIRQKQASSSGLPTKLPSIDSFSPRLERPSFLRQSQYERNSSVSSTSSAGSPPLLRFDSHSSKASNGSMDSSPSPITPAYNYNDNVNGSYDSLLRADLAATYLPSPSAITPFMDQQMMIGPIASTQIPSFESKSSSGLSSAFSIPQDIQQLPTPSLSTHQSVGSTSSSSTQNKTSPNQNALNGKKNKYPCPYAASHNCLATFTTSGHAARHGKKHTGEKGVHCPVCNKAFTRKDNMKQHERTHKNQANKGSDDTSSRSKAAITKDAQKAKSHKKADSEMSNHTRRASLLQSPISEVASLAAGTIDTPINTVDAKFYQDAMPSMMLTTDTNIIPDALSTGSLYPPLGDETLLHPHNQIDKLDTTIPMPPTLIRGFSDLDTLAQAAAADFDPYYQNNQF